MTIAHGTFTLDRTFRAPVSAAFAAWATLEAKDRWFIATDGWHLGQRHLDFRVGGDELMEGHFVGGASDGLTVKMRGWYHAIVVDHVIVFAYDMHIGGRLAASTLCTVAFAPTSSGGSRMVCTEQTAFLDGTDDTAGRRSGAKSQHDRLQAILDA